MTAADVQAVSWTGRSIRLIDQTALPDEFVHIDVTDVDTLVDAIQRLVVRGAPAIGVAGALGVVVAVRQGRREGWTGERLATEIARIRGARPTAVNLAWAVDRVAALVPRGEDAVAAEALSISAADKAANHKIGSTGADWILAKVDRRPVRVLTHCNAGALATAGWGTALGIVKDLHRRGALEIVYVNETRPLLQGARLTAWELVQEGIPHRVTIDSATTSTILRGMVDLAIIGADRIAANGDTVNKIGSVGVALACHYGRIPLVVAAPESTIDRATQTGDDIQIEQRAENEVLTWRGLRTAPAESRGFNLAFDITPAKFVSALVTESGVLEVSAGQTPAEVPL